MKIKTCKPDHLPLCSLDWESLVDLIGKAHSVLACFDEILKSVKNPKIVFSLLTSHESITSLHSQRVSITMEELLYRQTPSFTSQEEWDNGTLKILNYKSALQDAAKNITNHPISFDMMSKIHKTVKDDAKNSDQEIGRFRKHQNWIGPEGHGIEEAYYYPPDARILMRSMNNLKKYLAYKEKDPLVQLAIFFAQFLIIHPFMDGNGRVGRVMIPLFLYKKKLISTPMFYFSSYFKKHRLQYFEKLFHITADNDWEGWVRFFLQGIIKEGQVHIRKAKAILKLYHEFEDAVEDSTIGVEIINAIFSSVILDMNQLPKKKASLKIVKRLKEKKLISPYKTKSMVVAYKLLAIDNRKTSLRN